MDKIFLRSPIVSRPGVLLGDEFIHYYLGMATIFLRSPITSRPRVLISDQFILYYVGMANIFLRSPITIQTGVLLGDKFIRYYLGMFQFCYTANIKRFFYMIRDEITSTKLVPPSRTFPPIKIHSYTPYPLTFASLFLKVKLPKNGDVPSPRGPVSL